MNPIIRLRGDAPELRWTPDVEEQVARCAERLQEEGPDYRWPRAFEPRAICACCFAQDQGWALAAHQDFGPHRLLGGNKKDAWPPWAQVLRSAHLEYLRCRRAPRAFVVHLDHEIPLDAIPPEIVIDLLPASWHGAHLTAYVLRAPNEGSHHAHR